MPVSQNFTDAFATFDQAKVHYEKDASDAVAKAIASHTEPLQTALDAANAKAAGLAIDLADSEAAVKAKADAMLADSLAIETPPVPPVPAPVMPTPVAATDVPPVPMVDPGLAGPPVTVVPGSVNPFTGQPA